MNNKIRLNEVLRNRMLSAVLDGFTAGKYNVYFLKSMIKVLYTVKYM